MKASYADIRSRLGAPTWWDEHAVPRYCDFHPSATANIYADEVCLMQIRCQGCGAAFPVAFSEDIYARITRDGDIYPPISERIDELYFGDPPNAGCCAAGPTMSSEPVRIIEFWSRNDDPNREWHRRPDLERAVS